MEQEGNTPEEVVQEAEKIEARYDALLKARERGEKIEQTPQTLQESIAEQITME